MTGCSTIDARSRGGGRPFAGMRQLFGGHYDEEGNRIADNKDTGSGDEGMFYLFDIPASAIADMLLLPYDLCVGD